MILVADSGSTKTTWAIGESGKIIKTDGINPVYQSVDEICRTLEGQLMPQVELRARVDAVYFYGAGCANDKLNNIVSEAVTRSINPYECEIGSDLLGAAKSLCQHSKGIVSIIGTGSNSGFYDGETITKNVSPLGFILGDEGSGAVLGKKLVGDFLKGQMPDVLSTQFALKYELSNATAVENVYRKPFPNRYLASFARFLGEHKESEYAHDLVYTSFLEFLNRNIRHYDYGRHILHFTGSIAYNFSDILKEACDRLGMTLGNITQEPIEGLIKYHNQ